MIDLEAARKLATEAEGRADKATPGPWLNGDHVAEPRALVAASDATDSLLGLDADDMAIVWSEPDARFIAAARSDVPALAKLVRDMAAEIDRLQTLAKEDHREKNLMIDALHDASVKADLQSGIIRTLREALHARPR